MILRHVRRMSASDFHRPIIRSSRTAKSAASTERLAEQETFLVFGVKTYVRAIRCPQCRTKNYKRRKDGVCFHCAAIEKGGEA